MKTVHWFCEGAVFCLGKPLSRSIANGSARIENVTCYLCLKGARTAYPHEMLKRPPSRRGGPQVTHAFVDTRADIPLSTIQQEFEIALLESAEFRDGQKT